MQAVFTVLKYSEPSVSTNGSSCRDSTNPKTKLFLKRVKNNKTKITQILKYSTTTSIAFILYYVLSYSRDNLK
jgi:hypothetical protein